MGEFSNNLLNTYCENNEVKIIHSSPYHSQSNGAWKYVHKEIKRYIFDDFNIEDELIKITKIHNNKLYHT